MTGIKLNSYPICRKKFELSFSYKNKIRKYSNIEKSGYTI